MMLQQMAQLGTMVSFRVTEAALLKIEALFTAMQEQLCYLMQGLFSSMQSLHHASC